MMLIMDALTDKPDWHTKVFDDAIVAKWHDEALGLSDEALWTQITGDKGGWAERGSLTGVQMVRLLQPLEGIVSEQAFD
jgi:hypothetical protein